MEATEILEKARAGGELPKGWVVLPLLRNKVRLGILGWIAGAIVGFGFFVVDGSPHDPSQLSVWSYPRSYFNLDPGHGAFCWYRECLANHC